MWALWFDFGVLFLPQSTDASTFKYLNEKHPRKTCKRRTLQRNHRQQRVVEGKHLVYREDVDAQVLGPRDLASP